MDFKEFQEKKHTLEKKISEQLQEFVDRIETHVEITDIKIISAFGVVSNNYPEVRIHLEMKI